MIWRNVTGYRYLYRVSDMGDFQKQNADGTWKDIQVSLNRNRATVHVITNSGLSTSVALPRLTYTAFYGPIPEGYRVMHKNGLKADCAIYNLKAVPPSINVAYPPNRRPVMKVDRDGNVVDIYQSVVEAARENHISISAMGKRCLGLIKDPYRLDGYNYVYEEQTRRRKKKHG